MSELRVALGGSLLSSLLGVICSTPALAAAVRSASSGKGTVFRKHRNPPWY